jgi:hypothetical protein
MARISKADRFRKEIDVMNKNIDTEKKRAQIIAKIVMFVKSIKTKNGNINIIPVDVPVNRNDEFFSDNKTHVHFEVTNVANTM